MTKRLQLFFSDPTNQSWIAITFAIVLLAVTGFYSLLPTIQREHDTAAGLQLAVATQASDLLTLDLQTMFSELDHLGIDMGTLSSQDRVAEGKSFLSAYGFNSYTILDPSGAVVTYGDSSGNTEPPESSYQTAVFFRQPLSGQSYVSPVYFTASGPTIRIAVPITDGSSTVGVATGEINVLLLWQVVQRTQIQDGKVYIVDGAGTLVADLDRVRSSSGENLLYRDVVKETLAGQGPKLVSYMNENKTDVVASGMKMSLAGWGIIVEQSSATALRTADQTLRSAIGFLLAWLVIIGMLILVTSRLTRAYVQLQHDREVIVGERNTADQVIVGVTDAVVAVGKDRRIIIFNPAAELLCGVEAAQAVGKRPDEIFPLSDGGRQIPLEEYCPLAGPIFRGKGLRVGAKRDEAYADVVASATPQGVRSDVGCIITLHDTTIERKLEKQKTDFVAIAAHQLRTPLTGIKWSLNVLLEGVLGRIPKGQREYLDKAEKTTDGLIGIINNMLNVDMIESGRGKFDVKVTGLRRLIQERMKDIEIYANARGVHFEFRQHREYMIAMDANQTGLALQNLLENSIKYTPRDGMVRLTLRQDNGGVLMAIEDTGIGIPKSEQEQVFQRFFRASNAVRVETAGNGLGLFLVKRIIEQQKGKIWFESVEGQGTTFYVWLPIISIGELEKQVEKPAEKPAEAVHPEPAPKPKAKSKRSTMKS